MYNNSGVIPLNSSPYFIDSIPLGAAIYRRGVFKVGEVLQMVARMCYP
jgi:hypothetical protein